MEDRVKSPKVMFLGRERYFYRGLMGNKMRPRTLGAFSVYFAPVGHFQIKIGTGDWLNKTIASVRPNMPHQIRYDHGDIVSIGIEPERVEENCLREIQSEIDLISTRTAPLMQRLDACQQQFECKAWTSMLSADEFDQLLFGRSLRKKRIDPRIATTLSLFDGDMAESELSANVFSDAIQVSTSRFLHLFKDSTGVSFRSFRMWKRARKFLAHVNLDCSLTTVALDLGYPDSSHFSHSIRKIYGLKPRSIREGSRDLIIHEGRDFVSI